MQLAQVSPVLPLWNNKYHTEGSCKTTRSHDTHMQNRDNLNSALMSNFDVFITFWPHLTDVIMPCKCISAHNRLHAYLTQLWLSGTRTRRKCHRCPQRWMCVCGGGFVCVQVLNCFEAAVSFSQTSALSLSDKKSRELAAILCPVVAVGCCIALLVLLCARRCGNETCFKLGEMVFTKIVTAFKNPVVQWTTLFNPWNPSLINKVQWVSFDKEQSVWRVYFLLLIDLSAFLQLSWSCAMR